MHCPFTVYALTMQCLLMPIHCISFHTDRTRFEGLDQFSLIVFECEVLYKPGRDLSPHLKAAKGKARRPPATVMPQADDREPVDHQTGTVLAGSNDDDERIRGGVWIEARPRCTVHLFTAYSSAYFIAVLYLVSSSWFRLRPWGSV
jgi:hypothetical protein